MSANEIITEFFGYPLESLKIDVINVNSNEDEGVASSTMENLAPFLDKVTKFHSSLVETHLEECAKLPDKKMEIADKVFVPLWFSPSSASKPTHHPTDFGGNVQSEKVTKELGVFATHQILAFLDNPTLCAALASKLKYDNLNIHAPETIVPDNEGFSNKESQYVTDRGVCNKVGITTNDMCRYISVCKGSGGKIRATLICGDHTFLSGSLSIFKELHIKIELLKTLQQIKKRNAIKFDNISIAAKMDEKDKACQINIARLLGGAIYTHDRLCVLRDIYGVKKLISIDKSLKTESNMESVDINKVIDDYAKVKKYYFFNKVLNFIMST